MTKYYKYFEYPKGEHIISDHEIILIYWIYWSQAVFSNRPDNTFDICADDCVDDFISCNWAEEILK